MARGREASTPVGGQGPTGRSCQTTEEESGVNAVNNGVSVVPENSQNVHRSLAAAVTEYLEETTLTKKPKTLAAYTTALSYFTESCQKLNVENIAPKDLQIER